MTDAEVIRLCLSMGFEDAPDNPVFEIDPITNCWIWQRGHANMGYGAFKRGERIHRAHVYFYEYRYGAIPIGLELDHVRERGCRNKSCVNPEHLEPVSHAQNMQRSKNAKLTADDARSIRSNNQRLTMPELANHFGVSVATISNVVRGHTWRNV